MRARIRPLVLGKNEQPPQLFAIEWNRHRTNVTEFFAARYRRVFY